MPSAERWSWQALWLPSSPVACSRIYRNMSTRTEYGAVHNNHVPNTSNLQAILAQIMGVALSKLTSKTIGLLEVTTPNLQLLGN
jgi:hypothetical protein